MCQWTESLLPKVMASHLLDTEPLPKQIMTVHQFNSSEQFSVKLESKYKICTWKGPLQNVNRLFRPQCVQPHWGRVTHTCVSKLTIIGSEKGLSPGRHHFLNQCWNIVNCTIRIKLQWNLNQNSYIFIQEKAFEIVVCQNGSHLSRPRCVKPVKS